MYIDIYTFSTKPKDVNINQYKLNNHLNNNHYYLDLIIKSCNFQLMIDLIINDATQFVLKAISNIKLKKYQYKQGIISEDDLDVWTARYKHDQTIYQNMIKKYSNISQQELMTSIQSSLFMDGGLYSIIYEHMCHNISPLYNINDEQKLCSINPNPIITAMFEDVLDTSFRQNPEEPYLIEQHHIDKFESSFNKQLNLAKSNPYIDDDEISSAKDIFKNTSYIWNHNINENNQFLLDAFDHF